MIKIIAEETGREKDNKIEVDTTIAIDGNLDIIVKELSFVLFRIMKEKPLLIKLTLDKLADLVEQD